MHLHSPRSSGAAPCSSGYNSRAIATHCSLLCSSNVYVLCHLQSVVSRFKTRMQNPTAWSGESNADRQMAVEMVLHAADLSGPARPWSVSSAWAGKVQEEFCAQVEREEELGIPVSAFLTAEKAKLETVARAALEACGGFKCLSFVPLMPCPSESVSNFHPNNLPSELTLSSHLLMYYSRMGSAQGFIDLFAHPVWEALHQLLPEVSDRVETMGENYQRWKSQLEKKKEME